MNPAWIIREIFDYLIGGIALGVFAGYAFANGQPTEARWLVAFKLGSVVGILEFVYLWFIARPANRLILGGNLWLCAGGLSAFFEQWWLLRLYEKFGEASLFSAILFVGITSTIISPSGFVGEAGKKLAVRKASLVLLFFVVLSLGLAVVNKGNPKVAAIFPIIGLAWLNRALRLGVRRAV